MKFNKVFALGMGASLVLSSIAGAIAVDLSDYPSPFVKAGKFDAMIVIGQEAKSDDVLGAIDIGVGLQYAMKQEKTISSGSPTATTTSGVKIEKTGNHLNLGKNLEEVQDTPLSQSDLPDLLSDGLFRDNKGDNTNEVTYTQQISLLNNSGSSSNGNFIFDQPHNPDRDAGTYVYFDNSQSRPIYDFQLAFDQSVVYNNASSLDIKNDLEGNVINIQGHDYTVSKVEATNNKINKLTLFAGDTVVWLTQNQPITKVIDGVDHTIEVYDVTEDSKSCGVTVDGSLVWVDVKTSEIINGLEIAVTDAKTVHAQLQDVDVCQVNIGASKIEITDNGAKLRKNGKDVDGSRSYIEGTSSQWDGFNVTFAPKKDVYLAPGEAWTDPVFDGFKIQYAGNSEVTENMSLQATGSDKLQFEFTNNDGKDVVIPFTATHNSWTNSNGVIPGEDWDKLLLWKNGQTLSNSNEVPGTQLLVVTAGKEAHVIEISDLDTVENTTTLEDVTYGKTFSNKKITPGVASPIELSGIGTITLTFSNDGQNVTANNIQLGPYMETKYGANATVDVAGAPSLLVVDNSAQDVTGTDGLNLTVKLAEKNQPSSEDFATTWQFQSTVDTSANELKLLAPTNASAQSPKHLISFRDETPNNSDVQVGMSYHGTRVSYDSGNHKWIKIEYPKDQMFGNVFVTPISASVTNSNGDIKTVDLQKINVGAARLDSEVADVGADNLIVVGGPCVNRVAATLQGKEYAGSDCDSDYTEGSALVKLYETGNGKVALLVAGKTGTDTRAASRFLGNYDVYKNQLKGDQVEVTYTSLSAITVKSPE